MTKSREQGALEPVAGNGLLHRRLFLAGGAALAGTTFLTAKAAPPDLPESMKAPGVGLRAYGERSAHEAAVHRAVGATPGTTGTGSSRTPLESLEGIITPSSLHFERHHSGVPDIDPAQHQLLIHGLVERPLIFSMDALARYPMVSHIQFLECSGNSAGNNTAEAPQQTAGGMHGLASCSDWAGVPLSVLLQEAGVKPEGKWLLAEGADAAAMSRSVPMAKALDDAILALYQNGERLRPEQGYPVRLFLPGYEGNMNVKWLRRLKLTDAPVMAINESRQYTLLMDDGKAWRFYYPQEIKSFITRPSPGMKMPSPGYYQISGIAYSGHGRVAKVDVSADGGKSWAQAALQAPVLPKALTRFRMPWAWSGQPAVIMSRATDEAGNVQPTRAQLIKERGEPRGTPLVTAFPMGHVNCICSWGIDAQGAVSHVYV